MLISRRCRRCKMGPLIPSPPVFPGTSTCIPHFATYHGSPVVPRLNMDEACAIGDLTTIRQILPTLAVLSSEEPSDGHIGAPGGARILESALCTAVRNQQLAAFSFLLQHGTPVTKKILQTMCESYKGSEFLDCWLDSGGDVDGLYEGWRPLRQGLHLVPRDLWLFLIVFS